MPKTPFDQPSFHQHMPPELPLDKWQRLVNLIAVIYKSPGAWLMQANRTGIETLVVDNGPRNPFKPGDAVAQDVNIYCRHVITGNKPLYVRNADLEDCWEDNPEYKDHGFKSYLGVPIQWPDGTVFGTLCTMDTVETDYPGEYVELMHQLKYAIDGDLSQLVTARKLKELSLKDELTQLNNRRGFMDLARKMIQLARRNDFSISMTFFDLNGLKEINDTSGHQTGDRLIQAFARALIEATRIEDCAARMGGDEFVLLALQKTLPETDMLVNRVRQTFEAILADDPQITNPSFCFGTRTCGPSEPYTIDSLLLESDALMYEDKKRFKEGNGE
ncbi:sensor domain-containing diguanylate cyclase [Desulfoluna spongiiphila]|uniref:diguanylate cyclase n=1 Tax=Desulfoluna spongiiphila TaxID=419481 RepID=A0A1G5C4Y5_9BACT|nr:sensor domain-containing diguanylate cyclase [Desulfoluna spongiiphila]SCX97406.1 diguanylate cyclase (GGDEF) domain-containing protein [Desulfoluna spongiiphila]